MVSKGKLPKQLCVLLIVDDLIELNLVNVIFRHTVTQQNVWYFKSVFSLLYLCEFHHNWQPSDDSSSVLTCLLVAYSSVLLLARDGRGATLSFRQLGSIFVERTSTMALNNITFY